MMAATAPPNCPPVTLLAGYLLGRLDDELFAAVDDHVSSCDDCRASIEILPPAEDSLDDCLNNMAASDSAADATDEAVGPYALLGHLGRGGLGQVYRARHRFLGHEVAVKVLTHPGEARPRFLQETRVAAALEHPNVVRVEDAGETTDGRLFLAMELLDGENLSELSAHRGPLNVAEACEIGRQLALGLAAAHASGVVHRDVKPANALLTRDGVVKLLDLGLCRTTANFPGRQPSVALTQEGRLLGTPDFMAPEQARDPRAVGARGDLYALGCTLFVLLTGQKPFDGPLHANLLAKLIAHATEPVAWPASLRQELPKGLVGLLDRLLAKAPEGRPESAARVAAELAPFAAGANLAALFDGGPPAGRFPATPGRGGRRVRWPACIGVAAVVAVVTLCSPQPPAESRTRMDDKQAREAMRSFLDQAKVLDPVRKAMKEAVARDGADWRVWVGTSGRTVFALAVQAVPVKGVGARAGPGFQSVARAMPIRELLLAAAIKAGLGRREKLTDDRLLRAALAAVGTEFAGKIIGLQQEAGVQAQFAVAYAVAEELNVRATLTKPANAAAIRKAYSAAGVERIETAIASEGWGEALKVADHLDGAKVSTLRTELAAGRALIGLGRDAAAVARLESTLPRLRGTAEASLYEALGDHAWIACERLKGKDARLATRADELARAAWAAALEIERGPAKQPAEAEEKLP
jgi:hypothetical protein